MTCRSRGEDDYLVTYSDVCNPYDKGAVDGAALFDPESLQFLSSGTLSHRRRGSP